MYLTALYDMFAVSVCFCDKSKNLLQFSLKKALLYKGSPSADTLLFLILYILENLMKTFTIHAAEMKLR